LAWGAEARTNFVDSLALLSRKLARAGAGRRIAAILYRYYPAKSGTTTIHDFDGDLSMTLDRSSQISSAIYWSGHHSLPLIRFLRSYLKPEMTLVDVGANIGEITLFAAKRLGGGRVVAFEPMPRVFAQLSYNVALNGFTNVELFNAGLYQENSSLPLYVKEDRPYGRTNEGVTSLFSSGQGVPVAKVPLRKLDEVVQESALERLDFLKIDVEGAELMVLRGAEESIRRFRPVIVAEVSASNLRGAGYAPADLLGYLESLGYEIRSLEDGSARLSDEGDVLCFPKESKTGTAA